MWRVERLAENANLLIHVRNNYDRDTSADALATVVGTQKVGHSGHQLLRQIMTQFRRGDVIDDLHGL